MHTNRKTITTTVGIEGVGLHSGIYTRLELHPASAGEGVVFVRTDLAGLRIPAIQSSTTALDHATTVGRDDVSIGTVEHLLAAVFASGLTDLEIRIDGPEIPIIDGSSLPFMHLIEAAGIRTLDERVDVLRIRKPITIEENGKRISISPAATLTIKYRIDFPHPSIGRQSLSIDVDVESFTRKIAPARTFGFLRDVEKLRAAGLARGGSVENCIVLDDNGVSNGALRFRDEFVRHKTLDLIGDLALIGRPLVGEIQVYKGGHALHARLVAEIIRQADAIDHRQPQSMQTGLSASN